MIELKPYMTKVPHNNEEKIVQIVRDVGLNNMTLCKPEEL